MARYTTATGTSISTDKKLGAGGEGTVYTVVGQPHSVAKIYHAHRLNKALADKVLAMVADPPEDDTRNNPQLKHVSIAWPEQVLFSGGKFVGYIMPKIPKADDLYDLLQPQQRARQHPHTNHRTIYRTARNFALAMAAIHRKNYVIGDVNFKNALFSDSALITIVDCDSMQVTDANGVVHRCLVGLPEYTAPELQGADFSSVNRTPDSDAFGLAVLIFQLLMQGFHPFAGRPLPGAPDVEQVHVYCIKKKIFPYEKNNSFEPPKAAPPITAIPGVIRSLFQRAFTERKRPSAQEWADALEMVERRLIQCGNDADHWYPADGACVICEVDYNTGRRKRTTASQTAQMQVPLQPSQRPPAVQTAKPAQTPPATPPARPFTLPTVVTPPVSTPANPIVLPPWLAALPQNRMALVAIAVIVLSLFFMVANWSNSATESVTTVNEDVSVAPITTAIPDDPAPTAEPTVVLTRAATATRALPQVVLPACESNALLTRIWPDSFVPLYARMQLNTWPQTANAYIGDVLKPDLFQPSTTLVRTDVTLASALTCSDGRMQRYAIDDPTRGSGLACQDDMCDTSTPLFREYSVVVYGENPPSNDNYMVGKASLTRFFSRPGSKARYTVHVFDGEQSAYQLFARYQAPLVQHQFFVFRDADFTSTTSSNVPRWYDDATGIQTRPSNAILETWQRTISIPPAVRWKDADVAVRPDDYVRWFAGCDSLPAEVIACQYIANVRALNNQQIEVTYFPGVPKEMARLIQPLALPPNVSGTDITAVTTMLSDTMSDWKCDAKRTGTTWQCETLSPQASSDSKKVTFYQHRSLVELQNAMADPFDLLVTSAELAPQLAAELATKPLSGYTVEFVPTGALYALVRE